jgi:hypothetical protein
MHGLNRRIQRLERQSGVNGKYVSVPLPGNEGQVFRLPRRFAEWLARKAQEQYAGGRYYNYTDQRWIGADNDNGIRQKPTK